MAMLAIWLFYTSDKGPKEENGDKEWCCNIFQWLYQTGTQAPSNLDCAIDRIDSVSEALHRMRMYTWMRDIPESKYPPPSLIPFDYLQPELDGQDPLLEDSGLEKDAAWMDTLPEILSTPG